MIIMLTYFGGGVLTASKHSIDTGAGVIDADYRGPVKVLLFNYSDADFTSTSIKKLFIIILWDYGEGHRLTSAVSLFYAVQKGDRIAQLILERIVMAPILEVEVSFLSFLQPPSMFSITTSIM